MSGVGVGALAEDTARLLGPPWRAVPSDEDPYYPWRSRLVRDDSGAVVLLTMEGHARLKAAGEYPAGHWRYVAPGCARPRVTIDARRGAEALAAAIRTRLLPKYLPELARIQAQMADADAGRERARAVLREITAHLGTGARCDFMVNGERLDLLTYNGLRWSGKVEAARDGAFTVTLYGLTGDQLRAALIPLAEGSR